MTVCNDDSLQRYIMSSSSFRYLSMEILSFGTNCIEKMAGVLLANVLGTKAVHYKAEGNGA